MAEKINITQTQLLLIDLALATAIKYLVGEHKKVMNATPEQLDIMKVEAEKRLTEAMLKIKTH